MEVLAVGRILIDPVFEMLQQEGFLDANRLGNFYIKWKECA
jgi:hypothetical protein